MAASRLEYARPVQSSKVLLLQLVVLAYVVTRSYTSMIRVKSTQTLEVDMDYEKGSETKR